MKKNYKLGIFPVTLKMANGTSITFRSLGAVGLDSYELFYHTYTT